MSVAGQLAKTLGGTWTYHPGFGTWSCDDGRRVCKCSILGGFTGEDHVGTEMWLYAEGKPAERAEQYAYANYQSVYDKCRSAPWFKRMVK